MKDLSQEKSINFYGTLMSNKACYRKNISRERDLKHTHLHANNTEAARDTGCIRNAPRLNQQNNPNSKHFDIRKIAHVHIGGLTYTSHPVRFLTHVSPEPESPLPWALRFHFPQSAKWSDKRFPCFNTDVNSLS